MTILMGRNNHKLSHVLDGIAGENGAASRVVCDLSDLTSISTRHHDLAEQIIRQKI
jgi:hypothetical protein